VPSLFEFKVSTVKSSRIKDVLLVIGLVALVAGASHVVIIHPLGPSRLFYHAQAQIVQWNTRCPTDAPKWMASIQRYATRNMGALASQLAWISPSGRFMHCETGWKGSIFGDELLSPSARFRYASATKTLTAIAVLDLINRGKLSLHDRLGTVIGLNDELQGLRVNSITIAHLLSHRGGWDRVRTQDSMFLIDKDPWCPSKPEKLATSGLMYQPGEVESYSNLGYCLLGLAIEKVAGQPFREYMADHFNFARNTLAFVSGPYKPEEPKYDFRHENFYTKGYYEHFDFQAISSSAGISGNASDLARLVKNSLDSGPLTILNGDMKSDCDPTQVQGCYGYGLYRYQPKGKEPLYIHDGKLPGATSAIIVTPKKGVLVWLGAGSAPPGSDALPHFYDYIRDSIK